MEEIMQEVGGDGFLIFNSYFDRRYIIEVCDGLVPELQRRGVTRKAVRAQAPAGTICWRFDCRGDSLRHLDVSSEGSQQANDGSDESFASLRTTVAAAKFFPITIFTPASWTIFFHLTFSSAM